MLEVAYQLETTLEVTAEQWLAEHTQIPESQKLPELNIV